MNEIITAITEIKTKVSLDDWQQRIIDCRNSGKGIRACCFTRDLTTAVSAGRMKFYGVKK